MKRGKGSKKETKSKKEVKEEVETEGVNLKVVENMIKNGEFNKVKVNDLKAYLKSKGLQTTGNKEQLIDRMVVFLAG